jgi:sigma-B regulation protein RsbU (phosphoserine phosphatase)
VDIESTQPAYFTDEHVRIFSTLAPQIAIAIENARLYERVTRSESRLERDLERAREIQMHLMAAASPEIPGLEIATRFQPARELGGDLFDFFAYGKDRHVLAIGDVSGKGAPAALYGAMVSGILRSLAPQRLAATDMLRKLNVTLLERKIEGHFITLIYGIWEPKSRLLRFANAGMPLPILVRRGRAQSIRAEGVPLGLLEHVDYQETSVTLEKSDLLALFSDGIIEANDPQNEEFGARRLEQVLRKHAHKPVTEIVKAIFTEVSNFEQGRPRRDDQTLVLVKAR